MTDAQLSDLRRILAAHLPPQDVSRAADALEHYSPAGQPSLVDATAIARIVAGAVGGVEGAALVAIFAAVARWVESQPVVDTAEIVVSDTRD